MGVVRWGGAARLLASASIFVSTGAFAETICTQAPYGTITCEDSGSPTASGSGMPGTVATGPGLSAISGGDLSLSLSGAIATQTAGTAAISAQAGGATNILFDGPLSTSGDASAGLWSRGSGPVRVALGSVTTTGAGSNGIDIFSESGIDLTCGDVSVSGANSRAVYLVTDPFTGRPINATCGNISATGTGSWGVYSSTNYGGTINVGDIVADRYGLFARTEESALFVTTGTVRITGDNGMGVWVNGGDAGVRLTCGDITTLGNNSVALRTDTSDGVAIVQCGDLSTSGAGSTAAILAAAGSHHIGNVTTSGDDSAGVRAGNINYGTSVTVGNVTTYGDRSPGIVMVGDNIALHAGDVTTMGDDSPGVQLGQLQDLQLGTIRTYGARSNGLEIALPYYGNDQAWNVGGVTVSGAESNAVVVTQSPDGNTGTNLFLTSSGDLISEQANAVVVNVSGHFSMDVGPDLIVSGATGGILVNSGNTTLNIAGAVEAQEGSTIAATGGPATVTVAESGSVEGALLFGDGDDLYDNAGITFLTRDSDFGGGSDLFSNTGTLRINGTVAINGLERFDNAGLITMVDGAADDRLSLSGDYAGNAGATLAIDVFRDLSAADMLRIGGTSSGSTTIEVNWLGSGSALGNVQLVEGADAGTFTLSEASQGGAIRYRLLEEGGNLYLAAAVDPRVGDLSVILRAASGLWHQSADAARASLRGPRGDRAWSGWAQLYAGKDHQRAGNRAATLFGTAIRLDQRQDSDRQGAQLGIDGRLGPVVLGITGGYETLSADAGTETRLAGDGYNVGAYGRWNGPGGVHLAALIKRDRLDMRFSNRMANGLVKFDARSSGIDIEAGWARNLGSVSFALDAGVARVRSRFDPFALYDANVSARKDRSLRGRAGVRVASTGRWPVFLDIHAYHEFRDGPRLNVDIGGAVEALPTAGRGTWARIEAGLQKTPGPIISLWGDIGQQRGLGLRAGFRF